MPPVTEQQRTPRAAPSRAPLPVDHHEMSTATRVANLIGVVVPFAGVLAAIVLLWNQAVDASALGILAVMYLITAAGVTVGFHRLLTHRAFQTYPWLERTFAVMG